MDCDVTAGILHSQRVLAEITEMIRTSNIIHKSILNISANDENLDELNFGNKLSLLTGDYLLSTSFRELAGLKCHEVNDLISTCLRDLVEAEFIEPRDEQNRPLPHTPSSCQDITIPNHFEEDVLKVSDALGNAKAEWTLRHLLDGASLLAKCCQGTLMLAEHPESFQRLGYLLGRNIALAWQAHNDILTFSPSKTGPFSLICAPLLFHLQQYPEYHEKIMEQVKCGTLDYDKVRDVVRQGSGIEKTMELQQELAQNALDVLDEFPVTDVRLALKNIINSMKTLLP
ncbi:unnamed protein product [Acanthoscelides obtectus]|nr:unnamed protein product [Acanthoscelides obtectus]CAK1681916.1 Decaprenyl-diphosphate synthase subunit 2 [Acanthoscelides obtectus]